MNLIVGVLVEVVGVVAAAEQEAATRNGIFEALQEASLGETAARCCRVLALRG